MQIHPMPHKPLFLTTLNLHPCFLMAKGALGSVNVIFPVLERRCSEATNLKNIIDERRMETPFYWAFRLFRCLAK